MKKRMKKNSKKIVLSNRWLYTLIAVGILAVLCVGVYAFGTSNPTVFGHSAGELDGVCKTDGTGCPDSMDASRVLVEKFYVQTISPSAYTKLQYDTERFDNLGEYDTSLYRFTAESKGYYLVHAKVRFQSATWYTSKIASMMLYKNSQIYSYLDFHNLEGAGTISLTLEGSELVYLDEGEWLEIYLYHDLAGSIKTEQDPRFNSFSIHKLS